ncbi:unnamed protein product [Trifolium pratense]|uniref:Uncharacterized protein n=1 Tax=Trifolium pratense TaxID=57577 RepID=A0ACB0MEG9_TRIPR|nr:unnamed protein product [Trifolium pratense]
MVLKDHLPKAPIKGLAPNLMRGLATNHVRGPTPNPVKGSTPNLARAPNTNLVTISKFKWLNSATITNNHCFQ